MSLKQQAYLSDIPRIWHGCSSHGIAERPERTSTVPAGHGPARMAIDIPCSHITFKPHIEVYYGKGIAAVLQPLKP